MLNNQRRERQNTLVTLKLAFSIVKKLFLRKKPNNRTEAEIFLFLQN